MCGCSGETWSRCAVRTPYVGPSRPAALLEEREQARRAREGLDEHRVEQRDQVLADEVFLLHPHGLSNCRLEEGLHPVGKLRQSRVVRRAIGELADVEIQPPQRLVLDLGVLISIMAGTASGIWAASRIQLSRSMLISLSRNPSSRIRLR